MSEVMNERDFSTYELTDDVYSLANGVVPKIAGAAGYSLSPQANSAELEGLINEIAKNPELQLNIPDVDRVMGKTPIDLMADWVKESGVMAPIDRAFATDQPAPELTDAAIITGGVANWMLRRSGILLRLDPEKVDRVILPVGNRVMNPGEHQLVATWARRNNGEMPTEAQFARDYIMGGLAVAGFRAELLTPDTKVGSEIMDALFAEHSELVDQRIKVISNAPNAIQAAGELRLAGRRAYPKFDDTRIQVSMVSDSFPVARKGEAAATHQNPKTALGQIARNALYIRRNQ